MGRVISFPLVPGPSAASMYAPVAAEAAVPAMSQLLDLDSQKCIDHPIELDINNINSAELRLLLPSESDNNVSMLDAHLSANLSSTLNIVDQPEHLNRLNWNSRTESSGAHRG